MTLIKDVLCFFLSMARLVAMNQIIIPVSCMCTYTNVFFRKWNTSLDILWVNVGSFKLNWEFMCIVILLRTEVAQCRTHLFYYLHFKRTWPSFSFVNEMPISTLLSCLKCAITCNLSVNWSFSSPNDQNWKEKKQPKCITEKDKFNEIPCLKTSGEKKILLNFIIE